MTNADGPTSVPAQGGDNDNDNDNDNGDDDDDDDDDDSIELPVLQYGYRSYRMDWAELRDIVVKQANLAKLARSADQQRGYERFKRHVHKTWRSMLDYLLCTKFVHQYQRCVDATTGLLSAVQHESPLQQEQQTCVVVRNDFPYYTVESVQHYVLWKLHGACTVDDIATAKEEIQQQERQRLLLGSGNRDSVVDWLHWINPPHLQSLPDIDHVHILCLQAEPAGAV
jgi:hypothetical protein